MEELTLLEQRIERFVDVIGGYKNFKLLAAEASRIYEFGQPNNGEWDHLDDTYGMVFGAVVSAAVSRTLMLDSDFSWMLSARYHGNPKHRISEDKKLFKGWPTPTLQEFVETDYYRSIIGISDSIQEFGNGLSLIEIGGSVIAKLMSKLGMETLYADGGFNYHEDRYGFGQNHILRPDELLHIENYKRRFTSQYDFTVTCRLFGEGSGLADGLKIIDSKNNNIGLDCNEWEEWATYELLAILTNLTKIGGYSIHGAMILPAWSDRYLEWFGLERVAHFLDGWDRYINDVDIFRKNEPKLEKFPKGVDIRNGRIVYDQKSKEFKLDKFTKN